MNSAPSQKSNNMRMVVGGSALVIAIVVVAYFMMHKKDPAAIPVHVPAISTPAAPAAPAAPAPVPSSPAPPPPPAPKPPQTFYYYVSYKGKLYNQFRVNPAQKTVVFLSSTSPANNTADIPLSAPEAIKSLAARADVVKELGLQLYVSDPSVLGKNQSYWLGYNNHSYRWVMIEGGKNPANPSALSVVLGGASDGSATAVIDINEPAMVQLMTSRTDLISSFKLAVRLTALE